MSVIHSITSWVLRKRIAQIEHFREFPVETQMEVFLGLVEAGRYTQFGRTYGYRNIRDPQAFREQVPVHTYESFFPYIQQVFSGDEDVIWPGQVKWFSKSSGTTNAKSKFIPVTREALQECHYKGGKDLSALYLQNRPESLMFSGKSLSLTGTHQENPQNPRSSFGDISAVIIENLPLFFEFFRAPSKKVALMPEWEEKLKIMAHEVLEQNITSLAGVPTWILVLVNKLFDRIGSKERNLHEIWPNLEVYFHGGVNFEPYRKQFQEILPGDKMWYIETYNASEGFFGIQDDPLRNDMLLMLDYGIYYEFVPIEYIGMDHPPAYHIGEVELGRKYAMLISTNAGLWRYMVGDTIEFTSLDPIRIKIAGRTKHYINAFGEELMIENAEAALSIACDQTGARISNFTAGPKYFDSTKNGCHEWLIEFTTIPNDMQAFISLLDEELKALNSDYEAKRYKGLALAPPRIMALPQGTFYEWMKRRNKLGGQHKVPRLTNDRKVIEELLRMLNEKDLAKA